MRNILTASVVCLAGSAAQAEVLIFAAASLKEPVDRIAAAFDDVVVTYGGSGTIARQVSLGAPADIVLLANTDWMDVLAQAGQVQVDSIADFASNQLVLVGPAGAAPVSLDKDTLQKALGDGRIAVGLTQAVPAGIYAKAAFQSLGLWGVVSDHLAEVDSVRSAMALVIRGQTPLGVVYQTDVRISDAVAQVAVFPSDSHPPIRYVAALTPNVPQEAEAVFAFLFTAEGQAILAESGFLPPIDQSQ